MEIKIAVVPVAGLGTRLLPATKSQPKEMLPVGRKPVVQYVVEELARVDMQRILFITGPGKASIENHFDLDNELIQNLRQNGKEDLLAELSFERAPLQYFLTGSAGNWVWDMPSPVPKLLSVISRLPLRWVTPLLG